MDSHLLLLPTEILLEIFRLIPVVDKHALILSCRHLNYVLASLCPDLSVSAKYELRTRLAREGFTFREYAYCSSCSSIHAPRFFSSDQLDLPPTTRLCSVSRKQLWIEPQRFYSFQDLFKNLGRLPNADPYRPLETNRSVIMRLYSKDRVRSRDATGYHNMWGDVPLHYAVCTSYEILTVPTSKAITEAEISRALQGFDIPTCPHMQLGNAAIAGSFQQFRHSVSETPEALQIWHGQIQPHGADAWCRFPGCKTVFRWGCHPSMKSDGWKTVSIYVKRHLGNLRSSTNPRWLAQLVSIPSESRLDYYWNNCREWKDVNMAIEERRHERELRDPSDELDRGKQFEYEQLRRENDYLRHPTQQRRGAEGLDCLSNLQDPDQPPDELPNTTLLLLEAQLNHPQPTIHPNGTFRNYNAEWEIRIKQKHATESQSSSNFSPEPGPESELYMPSHSPEAVLESLESHGKFDNIFVDIKALTPFQRKTENFFWGAGDCLSMPGGLFGLIHPLFSPRRPLLVDQLYHLPRSVKRLLLNYEEGEERLRQ